MMITVGEANYDMKSEVLVMNMDVEVNNDTRFEASSIDSRAERKVFSES